MRPSFASPPRFKKSSPPGGSGAPKGACQPLPPRKQACAFAPLVCVRAAARSFGARSPSGALLRHSRGRTHPPLAQLQFQRFLRPDLTGVTRFDLSQVYRAPRRPVVLPVERWPGAARERMANPPAGTAPAPPFRHAFRKGVLNERAGGYVTEMGTDVKSESLSLLQAGWQEIISAIAIIPQKGPSLLSRLRSKSPATFGDPSNHSPSGDTIGGESSMRDALIIGALYAALGAVVAALAVKFAAPSTLWDIVLWGGVALVLGCIASLWLSASHQATGRPFLLPAACISLGLCLIAFGYIWHFSKDEVDNEYLFYSVDIRDPKDLKAHLPIFITSRSPSPFENVDCWWAPWGSEKNIYPTNQTNPYWSIGHQMKVVFPFVRGGAMYGRSILSGDYLIQYDTTFKGLNYHFDERLNIEAQDGSLVQKIDVWRTKMPDGNRILVYSSYSSKASVK
jgi:hypothetical protein